MEYLWKLYRFCHCDWGGKFSSGYPVFGRKSALRCTDMYRRMLLCSYVYY